MARFYIAPEHWDLERLCLLGPEAHHCRDVLRMAAGDTATVFNGRGLKAEVELSSVRRDLVECRCLSWTQEPEPVRRVTLAQAIPKGKNMEWILEKATELGAAAIVPLLTTRTVVQLDEREALRKQEKWQRVVIEAAKQCGQNWVPRVELPQKIETLLAASHSEELRLVASLGPGARHLKTVLAERPRKALERTLVLIGPEGDFTPAELALAEKNGCESITLGNIILRTETAAMYCLSFLAHEGEG
jgi:16S rRNA (uracil1498-N3)-methyltransferase